jgi:peptide/nickel transport system substrate-binding protein
MTEEIALQDCAAGNIDIFQYSTPGTRVAALSQDALDNLELYVVYSSSQSFFFNPYPDNDSGIGMDLDDGVEKFNPLGLREYRFAMNLLINRQQMVDEVLNGAGIPAMTYVPADMPGGFKLALQATKLGVTGEGDEPLALEMCDTALTNAAALSGGRLVKGADGFWEFDGADVTIDMLIRVDDPSVRLPFGRYFANQIEKTGIKVNRVERERSYCINQAYNTDPATFQFHIYTEGWGAGGTEKWREGNLSYMYGPWLGNMAGGQIEGFWQITDPVLDDLTQRLIYGQFSDETEYWQLVSDTQYYGLYESNRIWVNYTASYYVANKNSFEGRFLYGLGDGMNSYSMYTMVPTAADKTVRVSQYSARGTLFLNPWDPVGSNGFNDFYAANIITNATDPTTQNSPSTADPLKIMVSWDLADLRTEIGPDGAGLVAAPATALEYNSGTKTWGPTGETSQSTCKFTLRQPLAWHDGTPLTVLDFIYADGFTTDWATQDGADDRRWAATLQSRWEPGFAFAHGTIYNVAGNTITTFNDYNFPPDPNVVAASISPALYPRHSNHSQGVVWTVVEALALMIVEGAESGTAYSFEDTAGVTEVDILVPSMVADIRAKLVQMRDAKYVPAYFAAWLDDAGLTAADLAGYYQNAINFIDAHGHAYIGNGGYVVDIFDAANNQMILTANRSANYPFTPAFWLDITKSTTVRIDEIVTPLSAAAGQNLTIVVKTSEAAFPSLDFEPGTDAKVELTFITDAGEQLFVATQTAAGEYTVVIPGSATAGLAGAYTIVAVATPAQGLPAALGGTVLLQ